ncbi:hypothetical protein [uncultured Butyricimonas sp.]|uniref:hypothetical protein n=1 Tax=uncultured Butyricimonas sp. TaxID=1268785 RepID=UPI0026DD2FA3|nr:hypothetical protein [uncultured Butyricimonas sp.]
MADFKSVIALEMSGTIGDKTIRTLPSGKMSINQKAASPTFDDKEVEEARDLRIKGFGAAGHIAPLVTDVTRLGLPGRKRGETPSTRFMQENAKTLCDAVRDEQGELQRVYDFREMVLATGNIKPVAITATIDAETNKIVFEQTADTTPSSGTRHPDDMAYGYVFDGTNEEGELVPLRARSESGSTSFAIPAGWDKTNLFIYTLVKFHEGKKSSASTCIYPPAAVRDALVRVTMDEREIPTATGQDNDAPARREVTVHLVKTAQKRETPNITPRDDVYAVIINTANDRVKLHPLGKRGKRGNFRVTLPEGWEAADLLVYTVAVLHDLSRASVPRCHNAPGGADIPDVTVTRDKTALAFAAAEARDNSDNEDDARRLYAAVLDARLRSIDLVPLHGSHANTPAAFTPPAESLKRFRFLYAIAVTGEGKSGTKQLAIES